MTALQEYDVEDSVLPLQPSLNYTAPELVRSTVPSAGCSSDVFSFGCVAYHLIARKPLFDCHNNVKMVYVNPSVYLFLRLNLISCFHRPKLFCFVFFFFFFGEGALSSFLFH